jgi:hypothetical protein
MTPEQQIAKLKEELRLAKEALTAMYALRGGMEKPCEHAATKAAFRKTETVLYGYTNL